MCNQGGLSAILSVITHIIHPSPASSNFPGEWKQAHAIPFLNEGDYE